MHRIDRRQTVAGRQRCDLRAMDVHEGIRRHDTTTIRLTGLCGNGGFELGRVANRAAIASTPKDGAAALRGFRKYSAYGAVAGLNKKATRATRGAISLSSSSHLPAIVGSILVKPVTLPPGRGKLATKPLPTGSETDTKMTGTVRVCCSSAAVVGVVCERNRCGW